MLTEELPITLPTGAHLARRGDDSVWYSGWLLTFLATGETTHGRFMLVEEIGRQDQSAAPPLHVHSREDEAFYVIDGALTCQVGEETVHVPTGGFILLPRGVPHRYEIVSEEIRLLNLCQPAGFESFFRTLSVPAPSLTLPPPPVGPPDIAHLLRVAASYGVEIIPPAATAADERPS